MARLSQETRALLRGVDLDPDEVERIVVTAVIEDLGGPDGIDVTTMATIPAEETGTGDVLARAGGVVAGLPVLVAEEGGAVCGFASYGPFRAFDGYAETVEHGLYVAREAQRRGHGAALLGALVARAEAAGLHVMVAAIEARNEASLALHERFGFARVGLMPEVGRKFDRWLDLVLMQRILAAPPG